VARPRTVDEVAAVVRRCMDLNLGIVPQGGLTGLVGAAVSDANEPEVVMLLDRMNAVRSVDPAGYVMVVEAGCILEVAKQAAEAENCLLPITFGSQGSARIGGNVSTNARPLRNADRGVILTRGQLMREAFWGPRLVDFGLGVHRFRRSSALCCDGSEVEGDGGEIEVECVCLEA